MAASIESVVSFSVILAETFAAVGLSTLVPNTLIAVAKGAKGAASIEPTELSLPGSVKDSLGIIKKVANNVDALDILIPKEAKISAEFQFQGTFNTTYGASMEGSVSVESVGAVSVKAGYSMLYESKSSNKISLEVNFSTIHAEI